MNLSLFVESVLEIKPVQEILCLPLQDVTCMSSPNNQPLLDVYANNQNRIDTYKCCHTFKRLPLKVPQKQ